MKSEKKTENRDRFASKRLPEVFYIVEWWEHGVDPWKIYYRQRIKSYKPALDIFRKKKALGYYDVNLRMIFSDGGSVLVQSSVGEYPGE